MLSLYKLEIFASVVQAGSFSAAAQRLYMTQPAVSQHIQDLEKSLGTPLFIRGRRGVTLTPPGETLYEYTLQILRLVARAESDVTDVENLSEGQITIGATPGVSTYLLPEWIRGFREQYPNLNVSLQTDITTQNVIGVMEHKIDIAFVEGELEKIQRKNLGSLVLRPVHLFVVISCDHHWCERETISIAELNDQPFITRQPNSRTRVWIDAMLDQHKVKPHIVGEFDNQEAIKQAVMSDMGIAIMPDYAVERERGAQLLNTLRVDNANLSRELKLLWDANAPFTPVTRALLRYIAQQFDQVNDLLRS